MSALTQIIKIQSFPRNSSKILQYDVIGSQCIRLMGLLRKTEKPKKLEVKCPDITCHVKPKKKRSLFARLFRKEIVERPVPPIECCRIKQAECKQEPDLSGFDGKPYKTCGSAFIVQKEHRVMSKPCKTEKEFKILKQIEGNLGTTKENFEEKMPSFTTVEQRLLDLHDRRLHPMYKNFENVPRNKRLALPERPSYQTRTGPVSLEEIPMKLKFNTKLLESKNRFADYKRVEPPQQLVGRMVELKINKKPSIKKKRAPVLPLDAKGYDRKTVSDTLYQKELKF